MTFEYDVFLSYSSKDAETVHPLADRLRDDGVRVWLDNWSIQPGDSIPMKIQEGMEKSRTLVMCMSPDYFESEWGKLEHHSMLFRDPSNAKRRCLPLLIKECERPEAIAHFAHIDWIDSNEGVYQQLLRVCRRATQEPGADAELPRNAEAREDGAPRPVATSKESGPLQPVDQRTSTGELRRCLHEMLHELDCYPIMDAIGTHAFDNLLNGWHPLCVIGRKVAALIPDFNLDRTEAPNFPGSGGNLWHELLRASRDSFRETENLRSVAGQLSKWLREHYSSVLETEAEWWRRKGDTVASLVSNYGPHSFKWFRDRASLSLSDEQFRELIRSDDRLVAIPIEGGRPGLRLA